MMVAVFSGGCSCERQVSLRSGWAVANALCQNGHRVFLCDPICAVPAWSRTHPDSLYHTSVCPQKVWEEHTAPATSSFSFGAGVWEALSVCNAVFLALHGGAGEDGTVQACLEAHGIPYTGSRPAACALAQDKHKAKLLFSANGVPTPVGCPLSRQESTDEIPTHFPLPFVVKPRFGGSSVGVCLYSERPTPPCRWEEPMLAEAYIGGNGIEYSVSILGECALAPVEILPRRRFYDYACKYERDGAVERCPAQTLCEAEQEKLCALALRAHRALGLSGYSRIDFVAEENADGTHSFFCLEANALPGMTATSLLPLCAKTAGYSFSALCEALLATAWAKQEGESGCDCRI